jgi:sugar lactone lactonase YvrE
LTPGADLQRRGVHVGALFAGAAIAGAIAMLAFAPRPGATTTTEAIFVTNAYCDTVTTYPAGASGNVTPISPMSALCLPTSVGVDSKGSIYVVNHLGSAVTVYPAGSNGTAAPSAIIAGSNTGLNAPWGVAFDASGNIYVSNYDGRTVTIYPAGSNGNVAPSAIIGGSNTGLIYTHGIALDAGGNIYVANHGSSNGVADTVTVYPAGSNGNVAPIATIGGSQAGLHDPRGIALDANGNIYVANYGASTVTVYPAGSNGNVAPIATIDSPGVTGLALDNSGNIFVTNYGGAAVTVYPPGSNGNVAPIATIAGSNTGLNDAWDLAVAPTGNTYVANGGNTVTVYPPGSNGNVAPSATIGSNTVLNNPGGIALDFYANIYISNRNNTVTVYPAGSNANAAPSSIIGGSKTGLNFPTGIALDPSGNIYVANHSSENGGTDAVTVYPAGSNGNVVPSATIDGSKTGLDFPAAIALDTSGNIYVANDGSEDGGADTVTVYPAGSKGNVAPSATVSGSNTGLDDPQGIALDTSGNIYVTNDGSSSGVADTVTLYPAGSDGNVAPSATVSGFNTGLDNPQGIALDASGNIYVANGGSDAPTDYPSSNDVTVYSAGSNGNVAPSATLAGPTTELAQPAGIAIGPEQPPSPTATPTPTPTPTPTAAPMAARLTAGPAPLTFAARAEGTTSKPQIVTLSNVKTKKQNHTITVLGASASGDFAVPAGACVGPLGAGDKCKLSVTFIPTATGTLKGSLTITSNASNRSLIVSLKGTGKK